MALPFGWAVAMALVSFAAGSPAPSPLGGAGPVSVRHNHLVGGGGKVIRLLGVNRSGTEYACANGDGFTDSPNPRQVDSPAMIAAIRSWHVNAVRVPLNEACWLGINGGKPRWTGKSYRRKVAVYVHRLERAGIHPILDLHVVDPGHFPIAHSSDGLRPLPDAAHSIDFWRSVAKRYGRDRAVVFDLYNEPNGVGWRCLLRGCQITHDNDRNDVPHYRAVGTQRLVFTIRKAGARNVILVPGIAYSSNLSRWLRFEPRDPLHRLAASVHNYEPPIGGCWGRCLTRVLAPLARRVPIVTGEMGDTDCNHDFIDAYMAFADAHGISYLGWAWDATKYGYWDCAKGPALIVDYHGTPTPYGVGLRDHLLAIVP